ncbi:MAG: hypothetical protein IJN84_03230 [Clostridia bacterium]|nr:hypothetical protein [Clostridia bacterium]
MKIISTNKYLPLDFSKWDAKRIARLYAGINTLMAVTADGRVFHTGHNCSFGYTDNWRFVNQLAISNWMPGAVMAVTKEGRCLVSRQALESVPDATNVYNKVSQWGSITQAVASDGFFTLDVFGKVHIAPFGKNHSYEEAENWENIAHLAVGNQDSLFGITKNGRVLCAGANLTNGPHGNLREKLNELSGVVDICAIGAECERILIAFENGTVTDLDGNKLDIRHKDKNGVFVSNFAIAAIKNADDGIDFQPYFFPDEDKLKIFNKRDIRSVAVGHIDNSTPFVVALCKKRGLLDIFF